MSNLKFSQRQGIIRSEKEIQFNSMDQELKNRLWNIIKLFVVKGLEDNDSRYGSQKMIPTVAFALYHYFYKESTSNIPNYPLMEMENRYIKSEWYQVYDLIEFLIEHVSHVFDLDDFVAVINRVLEQEFSGYRIISSLVTPITNQSEIDSIDESIESTSISKENGVKLHLEAAMKMLSNKSSPDYRNSIKESISAVESLCRSLTGENTLGKSLSKLKSDGVVINTELIRGFEKLYSYTNSKETGIRHSATENIVEPEFDEAKFMLVSCSAFINYLTSKSGLLKK